MMNKITSFGLLILVASMVLTGVVNEAQAQANPEILLKLARQAQNQIQSQVNEVSSDKTKELLAEGIQLVNDLEKSLENNDVDKSKEYFLSAMKIFKQISHQLTNNEHPQLQTTTKSITKDPSSKLSRIQNHVENLKTIAAKHNVSVDFSVIDGLFVIAQNQINDKQIDDARKSIHEIKKLIKDIKKDIREQSFKHKSTHAQKYAQKYLERLDRLIETSKNQDVSGEIIEKLESARENLASAKDPTEIIKQVKEIITIKKQFELTKNDKLESNVMRVEKMLFKLSQLDKVDTEKLDELRNTLDTIKYHLSENEIELASKLLRSIIHDLKQIHD